MKYLFVFIITLVLLGIGFGLGRAVEAQSIGVGVSSVSFPILINLEADGGGLSGASVLATIGSGDISCVPNPLASVGTCVAMQTVLLAVSDSAGDGLWNPGDSAMLGHMTVGGESGETKTVWLSVVRSDDNFGNRIDIDQVAVSVTIP